MRCATACPLQVSGWVLLVLLAMPQRHGSEVDSAPSTADIFRHELYAHDVTLFTLAVGRLDDAVKSLDAARMSELADAMSKLQYAKAPAPPARVAPNTPRLQRAAAVCSSLFIGRLPDRGAHAVDHGDADVAVRGHAEVIVRAEQAKTSR